MRKIFTDEHRLYLITDRRISGKSHMSMIREAISAGIGIIQLRDKARPKKEIFLEISSIMKFTRKKGVILIINDYVDIALAANTDGVHIGQEDLPVHVARKILGRKKIIGVSTRTLKQARDAQAYGADYIGFGPLYATKTKVTVRPKGLAGLRHIIRHVTIPVAAIGGIQSCHFPEVLKAGADACAVASGILQGDIVKNTMKYLKAQNI